MTDRPAVVVGVDGSYCSLAALDVERGEHAPDGGAGAARGGRSAALDGRDRVRLRGGRPAEATADRAVRLVPPPSHERRFDRPRGGWLRRGEACRRPGAGRGARRMAGDVPGSRREREVVHSLDPARVLVDRSARAGITVVGSRRRGQVRSLLLGSVGCVLIHQASCPVAVAHAGPLRVTADLTPSPAPAARADGRSDPPGGHNGRVAPFDLV